MDFDASCTETVSPRLLSAADRSKRVSRRFDLKMSEFETADMFEVENCKPTRAHKSLSLKKRRGNSSIVPSGGPAAKCPRKALKPSNGQVSTISDFDYGDISVPFVPSNTNYWTYNNFLAWRDARSKENPDNLCPEDLLTNHLMWSLYPIGCRATLEKPTRETGKVSSFYHFLSSWLFTALNASCIC